MATPPLNLGRFAEPETDQLTPEQRAAQRTLLEGSRGSVPPPYRIWLSSPELVRQIEGLGRFLLRETSLSARENEIAILTMARHLECAFVVAAHSRAARRAGLPEHVIDALAERMPPNLVDAREQAVYDVCVALQCGPPRQPLYERAVSLLGQNGIAELSALLGYYTAVSLILNFHDVPVPSSLQGPGVEAAAAR